MRSELPVKLPSEVRRVNSRASTANSGVGGGASGYHAGQHMASTMLAGAHGIPARRRRLPARLQACTLVRSNSGAPAPYGQPQPQMYNVDDMYGAYSTMPPQQVR